MAIVEIVDRMAEKTVGNVAFNVALQPREAALNGHKSLNLLARPEGLEPPTYRFEAILSPLFSTTPQSLFPVRY